MADGLCVDGTANDDNTIVMKNSVKLLGVTAAECVNSNNLNSVSSSFYISDNTTDLCSDFGLNNVVSLGVHAPDMLCSGDSEHVEFSSLCSGNGDTCRKKRCADRYDSSESSDSGVAVLSCTDCSSSGTSDITDPGSPYSPASTHSSHSEAGDFMAPPWAGEPPPPLPLSAMTPITATPKRQTASHKTANAKRLKVEAKITQVHTKPGMIIINNNNLKSASPSVRQQPQRCCISQNLIKKCGNFDNINMKNKCSNHCSVAGADSQNGLKSQQGKITEYFKTQMKPVNGPKKSNLDTRSQSIRKISSDVKVIDSNGGLDKYFGNFISGTNSNSEIPIQCNISNELRKENETKSNPDKSPLQMIMWNKLDVENTWSNKGVGKYTDKKISVTATQTRRNVSFSSVTCAKVADKTKNLFFSGPHCTSAQKLTALLSSTTFTTSKTTSGNVGEIINSSENTFSDIGKAVCSLPKQNASVSDRASNKCSETSEVAETTIPKTVSRDEDLDSCNETILTSSDSSSLSGLSSDVTTTSPILAVPRQIRFPALPCRSNLESHGKSSSPIESADVVSCRWTECNIQFDTVSALLEHLQVSHVLPQGTCENYVCLWVSCKVYARASCSRSWLDRHILTHVGNKPYRCIVDGCGQGFSSQTTLERHVNSHFNQTESSNSSTGTRRSVESVTNKLFRRNGKKLRFRRHPWSARMFDYFDAGIMEGLQYQLNHMTTKRTHGDLEAAPANSVCLYSKIMGRRTEIDGTKRVMLRWFPEDIVSDEWVLEPEIRWMQHVPISNLSANEAIVVQEELFPTSKLEKHRRKPAKPA